MRYEITILPGDGIGPEVVDAARRVLEATGIEIKWDIQSIGESAIPDHGSPLPSQTLDSILRTRVALKGPTSTPIGTGFRSVNVALRQELDLYACVRPCKTYRGVKSRYTNVDLVIVRENTEDLYAGIEFERGSKDARDLITFLRKRNYAIRNGSALSIKPISDLGSERIVRFAFEYAQKNHRHKVTAVTKANIMKYTDGLFLEVARTVAPRYPDIRYEERLVDATAMQLIVNPADFDVLVLPNLYGDILSDVCAGLVGGLGVAPGANIGDKAAVFEATHGSAPKYTGQNKVNPTALILSGALLLRHLGEEEAAQRVEEATAKVIAEGKNVTYDLKPTRDDPTAVGTSHMADAIIATMHASS